MSNVIKFYLICCLMFSFTSMESVAQQLFAPFSFSSTQGSLRLSISQGEPFVLNLSGTAFIATMGFHQGHPDGMSSVLETEIDRRIKIYPNPAQSYVVYESDMPINRIEIYNLHGAQVVGLTPGGVTYYRTNIDLIPGQYYSNIFFSDGRSIREKLSIF